MWADPVIIERDSIYKGLFTHNEKHAEILAAM